MKYIIIDSEGIEVAVIFDELLKHDQVGAGHKVVSAGQVNLNAGGTTGPTTYGKSVGLGLKPRPEDEDLIEAAIQRRL
jgi:hypothetical protein